jgi:hypothetical protein
MFNSKTKKYAVKNLEKSIDEYKLTGELMQNEMIQLHAIRVASVDVMENIEIYINLLANTPKSFDKALQEIHLSLKNFYGLLEIEYDEKIAQRLAGGGVALGIATGVATAAMAPTVAMAIATTFGTSINRNCYFYIRRGGCDERRSCLDRWRYGSGRRIRRNSFTRLSRTNWLDGWSCFTRWWRIVCE